MKQIYAFVIVLTVAIFASAAVASDMVTLEIPTMNCSICPITVTKALEKLDGVADVEVDYPSKRATVTFDSSSVTIQDLISATTDSGFPSQVYKRHHTPDPD